MPTWLLITLLFTHLLIFGLGFWIGVRLSKNYLEEAVETGYMKDHEGQAYRITRKRSPKR